MDRSPYQTSPAVSELLFAGMPGLAGADEHARRAFERVQQLMEITSAIVEAVDGDQVLWAVVDRVAQVLGAQMGGSWLVAPDGSSLELARSVGLPPRVAQHLQSFELDRVLAFPAVDATRSKAPVWLASPAELRRKYPELGLLDGLSSCALACLPLVFEGEARGCLLFGFADARLDEPGERDFLLLVARYAGQALERLRLLDNERALRAQNQQARVRAEVLYQLAAGVIGAQTVDAVFDVALDGIERALGTSRCAILAFDSEHVMRFQAWRGLSEAYRAAVEGHSPWARDVQSPAPVVVADARAEPSLAAYAELFDSERIGALGFIPLVCEGRLIGKFMVYYERPRELSAAELDMAEAIANHVAAVMGRFAALRELEQAVRFNELFTGMLGHDLRNPLGAILAAAELAAKVAGNGPLDRPLERIARSGQRMATMIDQLLDFTRVRVGGGIPIEPRRGDLAQLVQHVVDELRDSYASCPFSIERSGSDAVGEWDADRIQQVFSNLVANAAQHGTGEGVRVRIDASAPGVVSVAVHNHGALAPELLPRLFEPMAGGRGRRSQSRGLGLGLYISREIISAHGGSIEVDSSPDAGTTFVVCLPRVARATKSGREASEPAPTGPAGFA